MEWILIEEGHPKNNQRVLITIYDDVLNRSFINIADYTTNLHKYDKYDFPKKTDNRPGFIRYDSEWGYIEINNVVAWAALPEPYNANLRIQRVESVKRCIR